MFFLDVLNQVEWVTTIKSWTKSSFTGSFQIINLFPSMVNLKWETVYVLFVDLCKEVNSLSLDFGAKGATG